MAFPASTELLSRVLDDIAQIMLRVKTSSQQIRAASLSGPIGANNIISFVGDLADYRDRLTLLVTTPGLPSYAQAQYNNGNLNIVTEFTTTLAQIDATRTWIITNFPKTPTTNELREKTFDVNGRVILNTFSTASLASFRTQLDALIATID